MSMKSLHHHQPNCRMQKDPTVSEIVWRSQKKLSKLSSMPHASHAFKRIFTYPLVRHSEMCSEMKSSAIKFCTIACEANPDNNQDAAQTIKEWLDEQYGGSWHVVVGEQFGLEISHQRGTLLYMFFGGNLAVCLWKCS